MISLKVIEWNRKKFSYRSLENKTFFFVLTDKLPDEYHQLNGGIWFVESFPRTHTGKIKRLDVKNLALQLYTEKVAAKQAKIHQNDDGSRSI